MRLCLIIVILMIDPALCLDTRQIAETYRCDPSKEFVDVELGSESGNRRARLAVSLNAQSHEPMHCTFRIFTSDKSANNAIYFRLNNVTMANDDENHCNDASVRLYDVDTTSYEKKAQLDQICSTAFHTTPIASSFHAMIIEVVARRSVPIHFDAFVHELPLPCGFFCAEEDRCLAANQRCNGYSDCLDGSDEHGCLRTRPNDVIQLQQDDLSSSVENQFPPYGIVEPLDSHDRVSSDLIGSISMPEIDDKFEIDEIDRSVPFISTQSRHHDDSDLVMMDRVSYDRGDSGCGSPRALTGTKGSFTSANYPCHYGPRLSCIWEISVPSDNYITLAFNSLFYIEPGPAVPASSSAKRTCHDWLDVHALRSNGTSGKEDDVLVRSFCGDKAPSPLLIRLNRIRVEFKSDDLNDGYGFRLHWAAVTQDRIGKMRANRSRLLSSPSRPSVSLKSEACASNTRGELLTHPFGSFGSPRFKSGNYTYNSNCTWIISGSADQVVVLFFSEFALEPSTDCDFDVVTIWDGPTLVGKYCGKGFIPPIRSTTNKVTVTFRSDEKVEDQGFRLFYHIVNRNELNDTANRVRHPVISGALQEVLTTTVTIATDRLSSSDADNNTVKGVETTTVVHHSRKFIETGKASGLNRVSMSKCGRLPDGYAWAASFNGGCHGCLIHRRWMLATTNCLSVTNNNTVTNGDSKFSDIVDWATNNTIAQIEQISIKTFKLREDSQKTMRFSGMALVELAKPVDEELKTPGIVCLDNVDDDDDTPDAACEFPTAPGLAKRAHHLHTKNKLSNSKCADILLAASGVKVPADRLHMFECFLVQDVDRFDADTIVTRVDQLPIMKAYCEANPARYRTMFAELPLKFCKNYEENWQISGILVHVLSSNPLACGQMMEGASPTAEPPETGDVGRHQIIAVYVRVSHFFEWIFTITGNAAGGESNRLIKMEEL